VEYHSSALFVEVENARRSPHLRHRHHCELHEVTTFYDPCNESSYLGYINPLFLDQRLFSSTISRYESVRYSLSFCVSRLVLFDPTYYDLFLQTLFALAIMAGGSETPKTYVPLTCHGHSRPVTHINFSSIGPEGEYYMISACKGMLPSSAGCGSTDKTQTTTLCFAMASPEIGMLSRRCGDGIKLIMLGLEPSLDTKALSTKLDSLQILSMLLLPLQISLRMLFASTRQPLLTNFQQNMGYPFRRSNIHTPT
jgi:hypothetical protein